MNESIDFCNDSYFYYVMVFNFPFARVRRPAPYHLSNIDVRVCVYI